MTKLAALVAAALLAAPLAAAPAQAQLMRTFVSAAVGNDANDCSLATPCRSFQGAHDKTFPDGEITVLTAGGYGGVTITKAISIVNDGVGGASVLVSGGATGITINAPAGAHVNLRGITVQGIGFGGGTGLMFNSGSALTIASSVFRNHTRNGILFQPNMAGTSSLSIANSLAADNGGDGILVQPSAGGATVLAAIDQTQTVNNSGHGLTINGGVVVGAGTTITATVTDSVAANNGGIGFLAATNGGPVVSLTVTRSVAANNHFGLHAEGPGTPAKIATLLVGQSSITGNGNAWKTDVGGAVVSFGDNYIAGNADGDPAPPTIARK